MILDGVGTKMGNHPFIPLDFVTAENDNIQIQIENMEVTAINTSISIGLE
jgi:hypothetical protein